MKEGGVGGFDYINQLKIVRDYNENYLKIQKTMIEKYGVTNPGQLESSRKRLIERNKLPKSVETIEKQRTTLLVSGNARGANNGFYGHKWGDNHPRGMLGKSHSEEARLKISLSSRRKKEVVICPHCLKSGGKPPMIRYHFDNCKLKR